MAKKNKQELRALSGEDLVRRFRSAVIEWARDKDLTGQAFAQNTADPYGEEILRRLKLLEEEGSTEDTDSEPKKLLLNEAIYEGMVRPRPYAGKVPGVPESR